MTARRRRGCACAGCADRAERRDAGAVHAALLDDVSDRPARGAEQGGGARAAAGGGGCPAGPRPRRRGQSRARGGGRLRGALARSIGEEFLLVELLPDTAPVTLTTICERLAKLDLLPVFAHPERCRALAPRLGAARRGPPGGRAGAGRREEPARTLGIRHPRRSRGGSWTRDARTCWRRTRTTGVTASALLRAATLVADRLGDGVRNELTAHRPGLVLSGVHPETADPSMRQRRAALDTLTVVVLNWNQAGAHDPRRREPRGRRRCRARESSSSTTARMTAAPTGSHRSSTHASHLRLNENVGFARGNNAGARALPGDDYLFVNSDAFVHRRGSVAALLRALDRPAIGLVVPRLLNEDLTLQPSVLPALRPSVALFPRERTVAPRPQRPPAALGHALGPRHVTRDRMRDRPRDARARSRSGMSWAGFPRQPSCTRRTLISACRPRSRATPCGSAPRRSSSTSEEGLTRTRWDEEARAERVGSANAALIREHLSPLDARLTIAFTRAGLAARLGYWTLTRDRTAAASSEACCAATASRFGRRSSHMSVRMLFLAPFPPSLDA